MEELNQLEEVKAMPYISSLKRIAEKKRDSDRKTERYSEMKIFLIILFIVLGYINYKHLNIGFLSIVQIDEWAFHGSLVKMYEGFTHFDIKGYFSHGFLSYGHIFWALNFFATLPFFITDNIEMTIFIPRMVSSFFAVLSLYFIYKTSLKYTTKINSFLLIVLIVSMPGFWANAMWFHPDWMMTFFIILRVGSFIGFPTI